MGNENATVIALRRPRTERLEDQTLLLQEEVSNHLLWLVNPVLTPQLLPPEPNPRPRINLDPDAPDEAPDGEGMEDVQDDDSAMMAMMGMSGFGSTKGKHVEGNQEGTVNIKKMRTWRQYMNRRGGFNRPLDKIK
ncbi:hypothetical protein AAF712_001327 [Marasmius tenuissimus]|uniref:U4/U6.U5 small nuclear ribonucleoprotein 27kDa protein domain-containing protein n=1 Tax=Marasmius tenuissimus TaxID=585030 RepID=A0ABR3AD94_9AGAR